MVTWKVLYTNRALDDSLKLKKSGLQKKVLDLIEILAENPYKSPPSFEKLLGLNIYSRRINIQHRLVYEIDNENKTVIIKMMYKHYGG